MKVVYRVRPRLSSVPRLMRKACGYFFLRFLRGIRSDFDKSTVVTWHKCTIGVAPFTVRLVDAVYVTCAYICMHACFLTSSSAPLSFCGVIRESVYPSSRAVT